MSSGLQQWLPEEFLGSGIGVFDYSQVASIVFQDQVYVFYNGSGNDGFYYVKQVKPSWTPPVSVKTSGATTMGVAPYTSPAAVVYNNQIYLFFQGAGNNGTYFTTSSDGEIWGQVARAQPSSSTETFAPNTSATAAVVGNQLFLIYNSSAGTGLRYMTFNGTTWSDPDAVNALGLSICARTSAAAVTCNGAIFVFFNGSGQDGTWMTTYQNGEWLPCLSLKPATGYMAFLDGTSPAAFVTGANELMVMWNGQANDGVWVTSSAYGENWSPQSSIRAAQPGQNLLWKSSPCGVSYLGVPCIFYIGLEAGLWCIAGL